MALPTIPLGTAEFLIGDTAVPIHSLTRAEVTKLAGMKDDATVDAAEVFILAKGCDITEAEATTWRETVDAPTADALLKAIAVLSGIDGQGNR